MTADTVTQSAEILKARRRREYERCRRDGITHEMIAARAKCDRTLVVHYFAARRSPASVKLAITELRAEAKSNGVQPRSRLRQRRPTANGRTTPARVS